MSDERLAMPFFAVCSACGEQMRCVSETSTLVGYVSPRGHNHDDNCVVRRYVCSNGHVYEVSKRNRCPTCDWLGKESCSCHPGSKVNDWPVEA